MSNGERACSLRGHPPSCGHPLQRGNFAIVVSGIYFVRVNNVNGVSRVEKIIKE